MILDGKKISEKIYELCRRRIKQDSLELQLVVFLVGNNPSSEVYVKIKAKRCKEAGIGCTIKRFSEEISQEELIREVKRTGSDDEVQGILIQMPLPRHLDARQIIDMIPVSKDVEGLTSYHLSQILIGNEKLVPCTPKGIIRLLDEYDIDLEGKNVCIIGYSDIVGKPLAALCLNRRATVVQTHSKTKNLQQYTRKADILMTATGKRDIIRSDMIKQDAVIIDIGISKDGDKIFGDVDFDDVSKKASYITPVPGGVGPMTVAMLIQNMIEIAGIYHKRCPLCAQRDSHKVMEILKKPDRETDFGIEDYHREIFRCNYCGVYFNVHSYDFDKLYQGKYNEATYGNKIKKNYDHIMSLPEDSSDNKGRVKRIVCFSGSLGQDPKKTDVLDIGSGLCVFLGELKKYGFRTHSIDPDRISTKHAKDNVGVDSAFCGTIDEYSSDRKFDIITLNKVLEHIKNPIDVVIKAKKFLKPGGFFYIELPDGENALKNEYLSEEFFIEHHFIFNCKSFDFLLSKSGLTSMKMESIVDPSGKYTIFSFAK